ncbi:conserved exported protein of unknown function [Tenacibaculum sp. 190130A14a]|uniref:Type 1 periplasmic binding fold superfamily protein n=1 Tax=Tenacibaculum polynesiense TaxID=3137857 RepID=A0ABM9PC53_9FLAO
MSNFKLKSLNTIKLLAILFVAGLSFTACSDDHDHDDHDHEGEVITTFTYTLTNTTNNADVVTLTFEDLDGEGGQSGTYTISGPLTANATYNGAVELLNKTVPSTDDEYNITNEVKEESDEHEFFYSSSIAGITITKTDKDSKNNPLGVETTVATGAAGTGTLTALLKHEPTKPNDGTAAGAGGSTDIEVVFNITVQ